MLFDLKLLRAFVAVAETENVGQAAERLHISQSPLSRQIIQLETRLGFALFERIRQRVRLTREGLLFLEEARTVLKQAQHAEIHVQRIAHAETGPLTIAYVEAAMHCGLLPSALKNLKSKSPQASVVIHGMSSAQQIQALRERMIDFGILHTPHDDSGHSEGSDLEVELIHEEAIMLACAQDHALAALPEISASDLDGMPWIALNKNLHMEARQRFLQHCRGSGFTPDIQMEADDMLAALGLAAAGLGITFAQASLRNILPDRLAFRSIPWFPACIRLYAVWRSADKGPLPTAFRRILSNSENTSTIPVSRG